jgi:hypothetical protein
MLGIPAAVLTSLFVVASILAAALVVAIVVGVCLRRRKTTTRLEVGPEDTASSKQG